MTIADIQWFIANPGLWVWQEGGDIRGFSAVDPRNGYVWALFVDNAAAGRGIGRAARQGLRDLEGCRLHPHVADHRPRNPGGAYLSQGRLAIDCRAGQRAAFRTGNLVRRTLLGTNRHS
ncbi:GNAT family N-acetyltransferase [Rhizobium sp. S96]|uniref:GNAT family N-acetyltransferase n=1 Tax=Rhizobium sp. S96 TaxID=3055140 RepID=UPI0025AA7137|nr:GNAT family N-acetyltransferase [Rhizobium sp. S96]MDM9622547.1 GNAT family N-acetyltransferase [Rhizobium sp. S96]